MDSLNSDTLNIIFKFKHQMEYLPVINEIILYKHKTMFKVVMLQLGDIVKKNLLYYSIYNPRFNTTCPVCDTQQKKRHKRDRLKCSNSNIWIAQKRALFNNGVFYYS